MITCPQCGTQNLPGMAYCEHCGAALTQEQAPVQAPVDPVVAAAGAQAQALYESVIAEEAPPVEAAAEKEAPAPEEAAAPAQPEEQEQQPEETPQPETPAPTTGVPTLTLRFPNGSSYPVTAEITNIGRSDVAQGWHPELDLIPFGGGAPDLGVSRHQARIQRENGTYSIIDVGSTNGTFVNGKALAYNTPVELHDGDALAFGAFTVSVSIH
jgi:pSer/pThr/pTyr-binding forkhead associated (FHA) protein